MIESITQTLTKLEVFSRIPGTDPHQQNLNHEGLFEARLVISMVVLLFCQYIYIFCISYVKYCTHCVLLYIDNSFTSRVCVCNWYVFVLHQRRIVSEPRIKEVLILPI